MTKFPSYAVGSFEMTPAGTVLRSSNSNSQGLLFWKKNVMAPQCDGVVYFCRIHAQPDSNHALVETIKSAQEVLQDLRIKLVLAKWRKRDEVTFFTTVSSDYYGEVRALWHKSSPSYTHHTLSIQFQIEGANIKLEFANSQFKNVLQEISENIP
jgi:hypothetical protein